MGIDYLAVLERYGEAFADAVDGNLDRPVPSCPGWTVDDLVAHLAAVQGWWLSVLLAKGPMPDPAVARRAGETGPDRVAGWREITARYQAVQHEYGGEPAVWVPWGAGLDTAAAVAWRQAHELVVHCWDAQNAVGAAARIPEELAADGVDEFADHFLGAREWGREPAEVAFVTPERTWSLGSPDAAGAVRRGVSAVRRGRAVTVTGTAEEVYLLVWGRLTAEQVRVTGDRELLDRLLTWPDVH
ncbi:maleylpyruvate isomerase family mycothiol-dependent enzyme [Actinosynnema sp. NPDC047251]|uniref:Mycothiol-dependent maleylpyruvate isomerase metal-binding domain-containing protein n=1 Tax=Saccharothrix espanaensis (strain ATCC 51144 / DSM 44229 / JCM 9112 / NBRC 15066 / NRRL 15764) TaxID=1179773 RepID=K0JR98_SACES|nr:maleylpyruvate isomerase family mycothiol-dependent enzyme [Saccharothrix espanaensis]CCH27847.1 hypothetical protein BN6_05160 [Saccharothrix espanaensis DSM 44229]